MSRKSKIKVPKRVAGVKIPKVVRKGPVLDFVNTPAGRTLIVEALTAAVGLFAHQESDDSADGRNRGAHDVEKSLEQSTERLAFAFGEGVRAFRAALTSPDGVEADAGDPNAETNGASAGFARKVSRRSGASSPQG